MSIRFVSIVADLDVLRSLRIGIAAMNNPSGGLVITLLTGGIYSTT